MKLNKKVTSASGVDLIREHEGLRLSSYLDSVNIWTIGYGHTGKDVYKNQTITIDQAISFLKEDIEEAENAVNDYVKVDITQNQFDALVSFVYNVGANAFKNSKMLQLINVKQYKEAAEQFDRWNKGNGIIIKGLVSRRKKERILFES